MTTLENNKAVVRRFNKEFIEQGNVQVFYELIAPGFIHHTMPEGMARGAERIAALF